MGAKFAVLSEVTGRPQVPAKGGGRAQGPHAPCDARVSLKLPINQYDNDTSERDVLLAVFEQLRGIRVALWALVGLIGALVLVMWMGFDKVT